uniref:NUDIX domain-containing protein n=1 Tax=uncultured Sphingomonas sp. TaxID=158754 RepID=UPI0025E3A5A1
RGRKLLLVKRLRPPEAGHWGLPGGKVDWLEPLPDAVAREVDEELGLAIRPRHLLCVVDQINRERGEHWVAPVYLVEDAEGEPRVLESAALAECGWFALDALPEPPLLEEYPRVRPLVEGTGPLNKMLTESGLGYDANELLAESKRG